MLEIVAVGPDAGLTWRREIAPGQTVRLGRAPENGWDVPWDQRVSREHADISWEGEYLKVRCLDAARNPAHFDDQQVQSRPDYSDIIPGLFLS